jgi:hypothetical protein
MASIQLCNPKAGKRFNIVDPDPHGSTLILVGWIRIRMQVGKNDPQKVKGEKMFCFEVL